MSLIKLISFRANTRAKGNADVTYGLSWEPRLIIILVILLPLGQTIQIMKPSWTLLSGGRRRTHFKYDQSSWYIIRIRMRPFGWAHEQGLEYWLASSGRKPHRWSGVPIRYFAILCSYILYWFRCAIATVESDTFHSSTASEISLLFLLFTIHSHILKGTIGGNWIFIGNLYHLNVDDSIIVIIFIHATPIWSEFMNASIRIG